jgi:hypothetical protein
MGEGNGNELERVKEILDRMRERLDGHDELLKQLEDGFIVQVFLEKKHAERTKEHAEWLARHETTMEQIETTLSEINEKANFLFDLEMRRQGGPEAQGPESQE